MSRGVLEVDGLRVRWAGAKDEALRGVDLRVPAGERVGIVGRSGSGKSTLGRAVAGLLGGAATVRGSVRMGGVEAPLTGRVGMIFQDAVGALNPVRQVGSLLREACAGTPSTPVDLLRRVGFEDPEPILRSWPHQLSGGMAQRVGIALALAASPPLLVADEPTSALDAVAQQEIVHLLVELCADSGATLLLISHDLKRVATACPRIAVMAEGRIVEEVAAADLPEGGRAPETRALLDSSP